MKRRILTCVALLSIASSGLAQQPANDAPLSSYLRRSYAALSRDLAAAVETMPERAYGFRPAGAVKEVRTFGEIVVHILAVNDFVCSMGDGKPASKAPGDSGLTSNKTRLASLLNETNARCTEYLATLTDADLTQTITTGSGSRLLQAVRGNSIIFAIAHSNEHYGNLVTYLRASGLVPPAAASQASFLSPTTSPKP
jgi:uncharacterized damage-inducible protein DinB